MITKCSRCNENTYETLKTHSYCMQCGFSPDLGLENNEDAIWLISRARARKNVPDIDVAAPVLPLDLTVTTQQGGF